VKTNLNLPDSLIIRQYLEGTLDPKISHELEKQALNDPFLAEAIEGYAYTTDPDLSLLQKALRDRIAVAAHNKQTYGITWQRLSIAAVAAVMFVSAGILFWMNSQQQTQAEAQGTKQVSVSLTSKDSIAAISKSPSGGSDQFTAIKPGVAQAKAASVESATVSTKADLSNTNSSKPIAARINLRYKDIRELEIWSAYQQSLAPSGKSLIWVGVTVKDNHPTDLKILSGGTEKQNLEAIKRIKSGPDLPDSETYLKIPVYVQP